MRTVNSSSISMTIYYTRKCDTFGKFHWKVTPVEGSKQRKVTEIMVVDKLKIDFHNGTFVILGYDDIHYCVARRGNKPLSKYQLWKLPDDKLWNRKPVIRIDLDQLLKPVLI